LLLPTFRAECFTPSEKFVWNAREISRTPVHGVAPPLLDSVQADVSVVRVLKNKEDEYSTDSVGRIQSSG